MGFVTSADVTKLDEVWPESYLCSISTRLELIQQEDVSLTKPTFFRYA